MKMIFPILLFLFFLIPAQPAFSTDLVWGGKLAPPLKPEASELVPVPQDMQKLWILNSCESGAVGYRFSDYFMMISTAWGSDLERIGGFQDRGNGRYRMVTLTEILEFVIGTKGDLIQIYGDVNTSFSLSDLENLKIMIPHIVFKNCADMPNTAVREDAVMIAQLPALDHIHEACPTPADLVKTDCQKTLFAMFDDNHDVALDQNELTQAWKIIIPNSAFTACDAAGAGATQLSVDGLTYFAWLFSHLDKNTDAKISFSEIQGQWANMQSDPLMSEATNILIAAAAPLALLPPSVKGTCTNCCIPVVTP